MKVSLTQEAQEILRRKVASGDYASAADVVTAALELLDARDQSYEQRLAALRRDIDAGLASGDPIDGDEAFRSLRENRPRR
ncbi:MAG: type II toxin-antitoxin system ParD family antitoxin [Candidatus Odyssella sp.]|nr:type II toxin-antitoxin system ParD family antitoxin [Candidatus Odyssella sp.]